MKTTLSPEVQDVLIDALKIIKAAEDLRRSLTRLVPDCMPDLIDPSQIPVQPPNVTPLRGERLA